ncbi:MAG: DNA topoisomerase VI subunit B, partial [Candidatus Woesearchaeota archaeon]
MNKAEQLAQSQREIGVAEFFARNRHLLGFDNKVKALMTTIKEAVDNSLDACEEAEVLPEIIVEVTELSQERFHVVIEDNGPGIVKEQIPKIFAKLLYGSKFHKLSQSRGQQGIGISASVLYAQLTTGKSTKIISKTGPTEPAHYIELHIDTQTNNPKITRDDIIDWPKDHGTRIEIELEATYQKGARSIDTYLKQTAITNPHTTIIYTNPKAEQIIFPRAVEEVPPKAEEIKPHPYGVELGVLQDMLLKTTQKTLLSFLQDSFTRVSPSVAKEICEHAKVLPNTKPKSISRDQVDALIKGIKKTKIMAPPTDCISPIGQELLLKGLKKEINAEFYETVTRPPSVYRGNPFIVEVGIAYGGDQKGDDTVNVMRFANRVPLLYQQGACAGTKGVMSTAWKNYGMSQSKGALPVGPCSIVVHIASVWVPFTSESKEAIAHYPEILKEMKLALQEVGRKLGSYINKKKRVGVELKKRSYIQKYMPHISESLIKILDLPESRKEELEEKLSAILEKERGKIDTLEFDATKNTEYDEQFAKIGSESDDEDY